MAGSYSRLCGSCADPSHRSRCVYVCFGLLFLFISIVSKTSCASRDATKAVNVHMSSSKLIVYAVCYRMLRMFCRWYVQRPEHDGCDGAGS